MNSNIATELNALLDDWAKMTPEDIAHQPPSVQEYYKTKIAPKLAERKKNAK
jgi:hypothetical protein